ncbi:MAG: sodium:alanine symporter family protein [Oscillospiraceae bacterium]|nr:sodium:alanine symporter family protein [Oscillospiraceae bacterium]
MGRYSEMFQGFVERINAVIWGPFVILLIVGAGVYFTVITKFFPITRIGDIWRNTAGSLFRRSGKAEKGALTPFQAMTTALAGTLGTGNIVGVSTAIAGGGPGAIFWMWVSAFFGMMVKYAEVALAVKYRSLSKDGEYSGGPMYYIEKGLKAKWAAVIFAGSCVLASFGIGNMAQSNSAAEALSSTFGINTFVTGAVMAALAAFVIIGGMKRIGRVSEKLVPLMALSYMICGVAVLVINIGKIPEAFSTIFRHAFDIRAAGGGVAGYLIAMRFGVARGIFANEAGLGSAPIAHASADTESPSKQGMWGIFEVFFDTIVMCSVTALVIITSGLWNSGADGASLTMSAFTMSLGDSASKLIALSTALFAFATMLSWSYYGVKSMEYIADGRRTVNIYKSVFIAVIIAGAVTNLQLIWGISDILNGVMMLVNLIAILLLSREVMTINS